MRPRIRTSRSSAAIVGYLIHGSFACRRGTAMPLSEPGRHFAGAGRSVRAYRSSVHKEGRGGRGEEGTVQPVRTVAQGSAAESSLMRMPPARLVVVGPEPPRLPLANVQLLQRYRNGVLDTAARSGCSVLQYPIAEELPVWHWVLMCGIDYTYTEQDSLVAYLNVAEKIVGRLRPLY